MGAGTGGDAIAAILAAEGVDTVFGIVDGTYVQLCASLRDRGIGLVTPRHESTAVHMAAAYARLSGRLGVCIASNGPGVANALPGVAVENAEGNRVLLITSSRRTGITYPDRGGTYQYFDHVGVIAPMAKWSATAQSPARITELARTALRECWTGRPGVVHLDIAEDLVNGTLDPPPHVHEPRRYRAVEPMAASSSDVEQAAAILARAGLATIHAGGGVLHAGAWDELARVAEVLHAPVTTSWSGRGAYAETSPLAWPMPLVEAVDAVHNNAGAVLCVGARLGETDWWGRPPNWAPPERQALVQVDIDDAALGRNRPVTLGVRADAKLFLSALADRLEADGHQPPPATLKAVAELQAGRDAARRELDATLADTETPMVTAHVAVTCSEVFPDDAVAVFDGGNTAVWGHFFHQVRTPNCVLSTPHMGMLGAGMGQALGAAVARPGTAVYCITGDGAFGMHPQEVETAIRHDLPVVFLVVADRQWGMVKLTQAVALGDAGPVNADLNEIRYDDLARSMGAHGERVADPADLAPALERCLESGRCSVVHVDVDAAKHLFAPGLVHFKKMHEEPAGQ